MAIFRKKIAKLKGTSLTTSRRHSKKKARLPFWQSEWKWQSEGLAVKANYGSPQKNAHIQWQESSIKSFFIPLIKSTGIGNVKLSSSFRFHCLNQKQSCHDRMRNSLSYLWLIQTSDSKKGSLVKGFTHSRRVPWVEIFKKVHTKLSSHQNEASRSNEVLQIPTSSDPKY